MASSADRGAGSPSAATGAQFEVIPLPGVEEDVVRHLPAAARVTITSSPRQGPSATIDLACALASRGMTAVPHLAARALRDENQLAGILDSLSEAGVGELFVIAGDPAQPAGDFIGSLDLLTAITEHAQPFVIGVGGHPEGHPFLDQEAALRELAQKSAHASYIVTQMCFEAAPLLAWISSVRDQGIELSVRPGVAGPVGLGRLLRIGTRVGVGTSLRMLGSQGSGMRHLVTPGTWAPEILLDDLTEAYADPRYGLDGVHIYTFNALEQTARWWDEHSDRRRHSGRR